MKQGEFTFRKITDRAFELSIEGEGSIYGSLINLIDIGVERGVDPEWAERAMGLMLFENYSAAYFDEKGESKSCAF